MREKKHKNFYPFFNCYFLKIIFRFFCPPPCVYLRGDGWKVRNDVIKSFYQQFLDCKSVIEKQQKDNEKNLECGGSNNSHTPSTPTSSSVNPSATSADMCAFIGIGASLEQDKLQLDFSNSKVKVVK